MAVLEERLYKTDRKGRLKVLRYVPMYTYCTSVKWLEQSNNDFEELQTMLYEVELIINKAPLNYVYPNTIETCLTPNYLLFCWQLL